ncbi:MAG: hypothetical protein HYX71_05635 [Opitutae bacterium]|nr:hypothetical protein [Opitutae bacterium]
MVTLLRHHGIGCLRWATNHFPLRSSLCLESHGAERHGWVNLGEAPTDLNEIRSVWYRHPAPFALAPNLTADEKRFASGEVRAAFYGLLRTLDCFWINHPDRVQIAESKMLQLKVAQMIGFEIPRSLVTNDPAAVRAFFDACDRRIVYKAFRSGFFAETDRAVYTTPLTEEHLERIQQIRNTPGIFQAHVEKRADLRVTVIGRKVFAVEIHSQGLAQARDDWRSVDVEQLPHHPHQLPERVEQQCHRLLQYFGLVYGAIDLILTPDGRYVFLENNPSGQFGWVEGRTGLQLTESLAELLVAGRVL